MKRTFAAIALSLSLPLHAATTEQLASDPYWIALGHYETGKLGGWRSYVDDDDFFLAEEGASNPAAELQATLQALYQPGAYPLAQGPVAAR